MDFVISETEEFIVEHAMNMLIKSLKDDPEARKFIDEHIKMQNEKTLPDCYIRFAESAKTTDEKLKELQKLKSEDYVKYMAARDEVRKEWEEKQRKNYKIKLTARQEYAGVNVKDTTEFNPNSEENKLAIYKKLKKTFC